MKKKEETEKNNMAVLICESQNGNIRRFRSKAKSTLFSTEMDERLDVEVV